MKCIGVAGAYGKTTASCLIAGVLHAAGYPVGVANSLGWLDGREALPPLNGLSAAEIHRALVRMADNGCSHAVMALEHGDLEQDRFAGVEFDAACITCLPDGPSEVRGLLEQLPADGLAVLNADDPGSAALLGLLDGPVLTVGIKSAPEISATILQRSRSEQTFLLVAGSEMIPVTTRMIGTHHVYNCLLAAATGLAYGIDLPTVVRGLESVDYVPGRLERIECGQPFGVFLDHARTPDALAASLATLREVTEGRLICALSGAEDAEQMERAALSCAAESGADLVLPAEGESAADAAELVARTLDQAESGDCVLVVRDDGEPARQWLYEHSERAARGKRRKAGSRN